MSRNKKPVDTSTYPGRVSVRLTELRLKKGWSIEDVQDRLATLGQHVPASTLYAYERGKESGGVDMPLALVPLIARLYGYATASGWLPTE